jgi:hypothetical protein
MQDRSASISKNVAAAARAMRREIDSAPPRLLKGVLDGYPEACCKPASQLLARYLVTVAKIPMVRFVRGRRHESAYCKDGWQSHVWLEASGFIVDITADQYDEVKRKSFATEKSEWHETFQTQTHLSYGEMLRMEGDYARRFEHTDRELVLRMHAPSSPSASKATGASMTAALGENVRHLTSARLRDAVATLPGTVNTLATAVRRGLGWNTVSDD